MRAMRAEGFRGYQDLKLVDIPKPQRLGRTGTGKDHRGGSHATRAHHSVGRISTSESASGPRVRRGGCG